MCQSSRKKLLQSSSDTPNPAGHISSLPWAFPPALDLCFSRAPSHTGRMAGSQGAIPLQSFIPAQGGWLDHGDEAISLPRSRGRELWEINSSALALFMKVVASISELTCLQTCLGFFSDCISWSNKRYCLSLQACSALLSPAPLSFPSCC